MQVSDAPPSYSTLSETFEEPPPTPVYSECAGSFERVLRSLPCSHLHRITSSDPDFVYKSEHLEVNLGPRVWGMRTPVYGLQGTVLGHVKFSGEQCHVHNVAVTLKGYVTVTSTERGVVTGQSKVLIICETKTIYTVSQREGFRWTGEHTFSIPFPTMVNTKHGSSALPPSFYTYHPGTTCEVSYVLKFDMTRRGLRRHESLSVPISYLPKSGPTEHPLLEIPRPSGDITFRPYPLNDRVKTIKLDPLWPKGHPGSTDTPKAMYLSLPSTECFTSGQDIPVMLSLVCRDSPALVKLLVPKVRLELIKRTKVWRNMGREISIRTIVLSTADLWRVNEPVEGIGLLTCALQAGSAGQQHSWGIDSIVQVEHLVRVALQTPCNLSEHVPSFRCEIAVKITTDPWDTLQRELLSTSGVPTPALGLADSQREIERSRLPLRSATL